MADLGDMLFNAFAKAETGGVSDPWIRTLSAPAEGSTAYGPVQITTSLMRGYKNNYGDLFTPEELAYIDRFIEQGALFNKFGREPDREGYDPRYDYGGSGDLTGDSDKNLYESVAKKMLVHHYQLEKGDLNSTIKRWRFGPQDSRTRSDDERYWNEVESAFVEPIQQSIDVRQPERFAAAMEAREGSQTSVDRLADTLMQTLQEFRNVPQAQPQADTAPVAQEPVDNVAKLQAILEEQWGLREEREGNEAGLRREANESMLAYEAQKAEAEVSARPEKRTSEFDSNVEKLMRIFEEGEVVRVNQSQDAPVRPEPQEIDWYDYEIRNQIF